MYIYQTMTIVITVAITLVALTAMGTRFVASVIHMAIQADKEKNNKQQAQIDTLTRELEEVKRKLEQ